MHTIEYVNAQSDWHEALPLGNGVFGGMVSFHDGELNFAVNHYEVYYTMHSRYSKAYRQKLADGSLSFASPSYGYRDVQAAAERNSRDYTKEGYLNYRSTIWPSADIKTDVSFHRGESHPPTGEIAFRLGEGMEKASYRLRLSIEEARVILDARTEENDVRAETLVFSDADAALVKIRQRSHGSFSQLRLTYPQRRNHEGFRYRFFSQDDNAFAYEVSFYPQGEDREKNEPFRFVVYSRLVGAKGRARVEDNVLTVDLYDDEKEYFLLTYVLTELNSQRLREDAAARAQACIDRLVFHEEEHRSHWKRFFSRSAVRLPDLFLERLWYLNLYVLACCSGKDGKRLEQASGLNGLWDIRQPTIWGSLWYWDVNIQATYWPVYTANHLELAQVFCDGFLSYAPMARKRAAEYYGMEGYAIDYPHTCYNCMWPWCAQFLWWYYEYTQDLEFLREKAYPMFRNQILFIRDVAHRDEQSGTYYFFPDVSPEQGPITRNSTITVSTVRYLLRIALEANRLLEGSEEDRLLFRQLLDGLPSYPVERADPYGMILKDSELAPAQIWLRHPSLLMPIFPIGEIDGFSEEKWREIAENTVRYVSEHTEIGVFPFGWISAAAARLGKGNMALRILYEQGIDLIVRANGMGCEETDRWINYCDVENGQLYYPAMMECVGEIVSCVNEMLLQSHSGIITVFPAVPDGSEEREAMAYRQLPLGQTGQALPAANWDCVSFENLLAKYGLEVSASLVHGRTETVILKSLCGSPARVRIPRGMESFTLRNAEEKAVACCVEDGVLCFDTEKGGVYVLRSAAAVPAGPPPAPEREAPFCYPSRLGRWVFAGKDENSDTIKLIDSFLYDYYIGNDRRRQMVPYKFSFGVPRQCQSPVGRPRYTPQNGVEHDFLKITPEIRNSRFLGFGFEAGAALQAQDSGEMNCLLQDYICGTESVAFHVELPRGRYELLVVTGGPEDSQTLVGAGEEAAVLMETRAGVYRGEILFVNQKRDGDVVIHFSAPPGKSWNVNLLLVKKLYAYL